MRIAADGQTLDSPDADRGIGVYLKHLLRATTPHALPHQFHVLRFPGDVNAPPENLELRTQNSELWPPTTFLSDASPPHQPHPPDRPQLRSAAVRRWMREAGADVLFNPNPLQPGVDPLPRPGLAPLVATLHDLTPLALPDLCGDPAPYRARLSHLAEHADGLVAVSENTRQDALRHLGLSPDRVVTVHSGVHPVFRPDGPAGTPDLPPNSYLLAVGGHNAKKNLPRLLQALQSLHTADPHLRTQNSLPRTPNPEPRTPLLLAGPLHPPDWRAIEALRDRHAPGLPLVRAGYVDDAALAALYRGARLLAFPSLHEGFGLPAAEAMACGCPVLASEAGALPEICDGGARLCDPTSAESIAEALAELLGSAPLRDRLRQRGLLVAQRYTWPRAAAETAAAIARLATPAPRISLSAASAPAPRPRLLWHSPFPPDPGGVAAYSASAVANLRDRFDITLVRDPALPALDDPALADLPCESPAASTALPAHAGDRLNVYQMGNNRAQCAATYDALRRRPGLTVVHDLNIHGFLLDHLVRSASSLRDTPRRRWPFARRRPIVDSSFLAHPYRLALAEAHGAAGDAEARRVLLDGALPDIPALPAHRLLTRASAALVCHGEWARRRLEENGDAAPVFSLPLGIDWPLRHSPPADCPAVAALRSRVGAADGDRALAGTPGGPPLVVACAGWLEPTRRLDAVIPALAEAGRLAEGRGAASPVLLLAGAVDPPHRRWLDQLARDHGVAERIHWLGFVDDELAFHAALAAADVVVHLRRPTNGESSSTVLRALALGRPVVVSDLDSYADLPDAACWKVDPDPVLEAPLLAAYLDELGAWPELRAAMSTAARLHVETQHAWPAVADRFAEILHLTFEHLRRAQPRKSAS